LEIEVNLQSLLVLNFLRGKRTYLIGTLTVLSALIFWLTGDLSFDDAAKQILEGLSFMALRAGIGVPATAGQVETHESRLREMAAEMWRKAKAEQPDLPDLEPDEILARLQSQPNQDRATPSP
jgi:hypothetical protein